MFCPQCKAEYRPGFHHCADCDVDLVDALAAETSASEFADSDLVTIWAGEDESDCISQCRLLKNADIPYAVRRPVDSDGARFYLNQKYELFVSSDDKERAEKLLGLSEEAENLSQNSDEDDENQTLFELPDGGPVAGTAVEPHKRDSYLNPFYPEDATAEVWPKSLSSEAWAVEMSLKENRIRVRVDVQKDGSKKFFVLPEDRAAAYEIVREIVEGSLPS